MQFSVYQQSHIGGRKLNQDRMGYLYTREALLLVLADGMGGHLRGEVAATIALQSLAARFKALYARLCSLPSIESCRSTPSCAARIDSTSSTMWPRRAGRQPRRRRSAGWKPGPARFRSAGSTGSQRLWESMRRTWSREAARAQSCRSSRF